MPGSSSSHTHLARSFERSLVDPEEAALDGVRALMAATRSNSGYLILGVRLKGRPRKNERDSLLGFRIAFYRRASPVNARATKIIAAKFTSSSYLDDPLVAATIERSYAPWVGRVVDQVGRKGADAYLASPLSRAMQRIDELRATLPLGRDAFLVMVVQRLRYGERYERADCATVAGLIAALDTPWRRFGEHHGIFEGRCVLGPREVEAYRLLLTEKSEKEIAAALQLSVHTTHDLVRLVYEKLRVRGRLGLLCRAREGAAQREP